MLGRVWWGLVWTVCMITVVSSSPCREGVEYYNSGEGRCVPCTRCEGHLVVVIKCYVYQDAVCAPVLAVIAGGPLPSEHSLEEETVDMEKENQNRSVIQHRKASFDPHDVPHFQNFSALRSTREKGSFKDPDSDVEGEREMHHKDKKGRRRPKEEKGSRPLRHRHPSHRKVQSHRQAGSSSEDMVTHSNDSYTSGAIDMSIVSLSDVWRGPEDPSDSVERTGASSAKNPEGLEEEEVVEEGEGEKEKEQRQGWDWQTIMYLSTALIVALSVILLIKAALCHIRSCHNKKRLATQEGEAQVVTQLLPCEPHAVPRETQVVQSHQQQQRQHVQQQHLQNQQQSPLPNHQHPDAAYTMDRLLERRRVTESLETNLYVDSCRRDSQANVLHLFPSTPVLSQIGGSVAGGSMSASTTPRVRRAYRARGAPVSASASPVISSRNAFLWNSMMAGAGRQQGGYPVGQRGGQGSSWLTHSANPGAVSVGFNHQDSRGQPL